MRIARNGATCCGASATSAEGNRGYGYHKAAFRDGLPRWKRIDGRGRSSVRLSLIEEQRIEASRVRNE